MYTTINRTSVFQQLCILANTLCASAWLLFCLQLNHSVKYVVSHCIFFLFFIAALFFSFIYLFIYLFVLNFVIHWNDISLVTNETELTSLQANISHLAITFKKYLFIFWTTFFYWVFLFLVTCRNPSYIWNMTHVLEIYITNIFSHLYCLITLLMLFSLFYLIYHKKKWSEKWKWVSWS